MFQPRIEVKYKIDGALFSEFFKDIEEHLVKHEYHFQKIHNVYYDNDHDGVIRHSIAEPLFKEKLRIRAYEKNCQCCEKAFVELKIKYKGVVHKKREPVSIDVANVLIKGGDLGAVLPNNTGTKNILAFLAKTKSYPKIYLSYDRYSYLSQDDDDLRITFDTNLKSRREDLAFKTSNKDVSYFDTPTYLMEVKTTKGFPLWLISALNKHKVYPTAFSKYGKIYEKEQQTAPVTAEVNEVAELVAV